MKKMRIVMAFSAAVCTVAHAQQVVEVNPLTGNTVQIVSPQVVSPQVDNKPKVVEVTVNNVQPMPVVQPPAVVVQPPAVVVPAPEKEKGEKKLDGAGRVTEIRDEHVEVIDGKLEVVSRTIKQKESRVIGQPAPAVNAGVTPEVKPEVKVETAAVVVAAVASTPLEPPASEASDARRLVHYFCLCWKDGDYARMWWAMSPRYRLKAKYEEFCAVFAQDAARNGGLSDESIGSGEKHDDFGGTLDVVLRFKLHRVKPRKVKVVCERTKDGYRIAESGIIPIDLNDL